MHTYTYTYYEAPTQTRDTDATRDTAFSQKPGYDTRSILYIFFNNINVFNHIYEIK